MTGVVSRRRRVAPCSARRSERGTGLLGTTIGVAVVLAVLGLAVNVSLGLWTRSTVDSVAYDAAREVASSAAADRDDAAGDAVAEQSATARARQVLGPYGAQVEFDFEQAPGDDRIVLHVVAPGVSLLPRMFDGGPVVGALDRRIVVRREGVGS